MFVNLCHFSCHFGVARCSRFALSFSNVFAKAFFSFTGVSSTTTTQSNPLTTSTSNSDPGHDICGTSAGIKAILCHKHKSRLLYALRFQAWNPTPIIVTDTTFVYQMVKATGFYTMEIAPLAFISTPKPYSAIGLRKPNARSLHPKRSFKPNSLAREVDGSPMVRLLQPSMAFFER